MRSKITVIGAGFVGSTLVQRLAERDYADVVMYDIIPNMPQGKALDMLQAGPVIGYDSLVVGTNEYADTADSDIVVITSGFPRKPGMTRDDLVKKNQEIVSQVTQEVVKHSPDCIIIMVTNPLDAMAQLAYHTSGFPRHRVIGMAGVLDTARFRTFIAQELNVSVRDVQAYLLGEYGIHGLFVGVPVKLGAQGLAQIIEIELTQNEQSLLQNSAQAVKELVDVMGI